MAVGDLAARLAALESETTVAEVSTLDVRPIRIDLLHGQLPLLEAAGLLEWDRPAGTVAPTDHPLLRELPPDGGLRPGIAGGTDVLATLAKERRRTVLSVLEERDGPTTETDVARTIARLEAGADGVPGDETIDALRASLHHVDLPKLEEAGLVEHDRESSTAVAVGRAARVEEHLARLREASTPSGWPDASHLAG